MKGIHSIKEKRKCETVYRKIKLDKDTCSSKELKVNMLERIIFPFQKYL